MSSLAKRALLTVLTVLGIVLLAVGAWFMVNLGTSGSATLSATPASGSVVVLTPSVLNRVDGPVTVTATAKNGGPVFLGLASPGDAEAIVGGADRTTVSGAHVRDWSLVSSRAGAGPAPALAQADIWHHAQQGRGTVRLQVDQADAPESLVVATAQGAPADLSSLTLTVQRQTWFVQSLLAAVLGLLAAAAGSTGLWRMHRPSASRPEPAAGPVPHDADVHDADVRDADEEVTS